MRGGEKIKRLRLYYVAYLIVHLICWYFSDHPLPASPLKEEEWPSWSPDGQQVVYECYLNGPRKDADLVSENNKDVYFFTEEAADLCINDLATHKRIRLTRGGGGDRHPSWSPDGAQIAYLRPDGIYLISPNGWGRRRLVQLESPLYTLSWQGTRESVVKWSPEGDALLFSGCLGHWNQDVYVVNVETGALTNLTPDSLTEDFAPSWTLDGSKISFLSTDSSSEYGCGPNEEALPKMKVMNADGTDERVVYDPEFYYPYRQVSVSNSGKIAFLSNMISRTREEYYDYPTEEGDLYVLDLVTGQLVKVLDVVSDLDRIGWPVWSPDGRRIASYYVSSSDLAVLGVETGRVTRTGKVVEPFWVWSPDSQRLAVTVSTEWRFVWETEEHISIYDTQSRTYQPLVQK